MSSLTIEREQLWSEQVKKEVDRDYLNMGDRIGNIVGIVFILFFTGAILYLQKLGYIFSPEFTTLDALFLYSVLLFGIAPGLVRIITGRKNVGRLFEVINALLFLIVGTYFLIKFPFQIDGLYGILPGEIQIALEWLDNSIFRILLIIGLLVTALSSIYNAIMYLLVRNELRKKDSRSNNA
ncbi:MAG: hypothetical protein GX369_06585 [Euryarchaeota archaeon]|nr:hypothetical protein [Euryarchaeota archaeon]